MGFATTILLYRRSAQKKTARNVHLSESNLLAFPIEKCAAVLNRGLLDDLQHASAALRWLKWR